jgi:hypothetical protein
MLNIVTNPVVVGLFFGVITYLYLSWSNTPKKSKKNKKHKQKESQPSYIIPVVVGVITWFLMYCYLEYYVNKSEISTNQEKYTLKRDSLTDSEVKRSFRMIRTGVSVPRTLNTTKMELPDVFINAI